MASEAEEGFEHCASCGKLIPATNFELHALRCESTRQAGGSQRGEGRTRSFLGVLLSILSVFAVIYLYLFIQWRAETRSNPDVHADHPGFNIVLLDRFMGDTLRAAYLDRVPPSFLPDVWPESSFAWTHVIDDFWMAGIRPPLKDRSRLVADSSLTPEQAATLKEDFLAMTERLGRFSWKTLPWARGVCGRKDAGSLCAVHRWNAFVEERLIGRVQCWTDASLMQWDPTFVQTNPLFHPTFVKSSVFLCLVDVPGFAASLAAPQDLPLLHINNLLWHCPSTFSTNVNIENGDFPANIMRKSLQPYFFQFLDEYIGDDESQVPDDDEGEVIDLDLDDDPPLCDEL